MQGRHLGSVDGPLAISLGDFLGDSTIGDELIILPTGIKFLYSQHNPKRLLKATTIDLIGLGQGPVDIKNNKLHSSS